MFTKKRDSIFIAVQPAQLHRHARAARVRKSANTVCAKATNPRNKQDCSTSLYAGLCFDISGQVAYMCIYIYIYIYRETPCRQMPLLAYF